MSSLRHCDLSVLFVNDSFLWSIEWRLRPSTCGLYQQCPNTKHVCLSKCFSYCFCLSFGSMLFWIQFTDLIGMRQGGTLCTRLFVLFLHQQAAVNIMEEYGILHPFFVLCEFLYQSVSLSSVSRLFVLSKWRKLSNENLFCNLYCTCHVLHTCNRIQFEKIQ